jgi:hypothetical protein
MKTAAAVVSLLALVGAANASVIILDGAGVIPGATNFIDFDSPFVASGPYAGNTWASAGFSNFELTGTWTPGTDTITAASNGSGQSMGSQRGAGTGPGPGALAIMGVGGAIDNVAAGGGIMVTLASPASGFSWLFVDQINMGYQVELFDGATSLGIAGATYAGSFPRPASQVNAQGAQFDRVHITFTGAVTGIAFDNFAYVAVPAPASLALLGLGGFVASRRRR